MARKKRRRPPPPPWDERHDHLMTRAEARRIGRTFYYTGRLCSGSYGRHDHYRYTSSGGCVECQRLSDQRRQSRKITKTPEWQAHDRARQKWRKERGLARGRVPGSRAGYPLRLPEWRTAEDEKALLATRTSCPRKYVVDHIVGPNHYNHGNLISGLDTAQNLQHLTQSQNRRKDSRLPDPDDYSVGCNRPLTLDELRFFVRKGMAVWSKDVSFDGYVNWRLYQREADGLITYDGQEPGIAEAAE